MAVSNERKISINLEKTASFLNGFLLFGMAGAFFAGVFWNEKWHWLAGLTLILNLLNFYYLYIQKQHTLLANFGLLALFRYLVESIGPEFRQYLYSSDTEEKPFNRTERADIYKKAKNIEKSSAFGSLLDFDKATLKLKHSFYPVDKKNTEPFYLCFGEERHLKQAYTVNKAVMIGGMSYGALGKKRHSGPVPWEPKKAEIPLNTGEGGFPKYHLMGGADLIFQIGTAKFGVRNEDGTFSSDLLEKISRNKQIKMIELKFSPGSQTGKRGTFTKRKDNRGNCQTQRHSNGKRCYFPRRTHRVRVRPVYCGVYQKNPGNLPPARGNQILPWFHQGNGGNVHGNEKTKSLSRLHCH